MAELINLAGTTSHSFTIGEDGVTTYHGNIVPSLSVGKPGDIYIQDTTEIEDQHGEGTGVFRPYGKVFMKLVVDGVEKWEPIKNYTFDTPIIKDEETEDESNNYKISLKQADNDTTTVVTSTKTNDYEKNHDNFGVTRYATDTEVIPSSADVTTFLNNYKTYDTTAANFPKIYDNYSPDKFIAETPNQVASNIEVEMKRALKTEGKLNNLTTRTKNDLVSAINELDSDLGTVSSAMTAGTALGGKTISTGNNTDVSAATAISTLNTKAGVLTSLTTDEKNTLVGAINEVDANTDTNTQNIGSVTTPMATGTALAGKTIATGNNTDITVANALSTLNTAVKTNKDNIGDLGNLDTAANNLVEAINTEATTRSNADNNLQNQIDAIVSKSDVVDVVSCYDRGSDTSKTDIVHYNTSTLGDNDVIKVLIDETHDNATTYYRWDTTTSQFEYIGPEGSYYTKSEADNRFVNVDGDTMTGTLTLSSTGGIDATAGSISVPTLAVGTNTTGAASTAFVKTAIDNEDALVVHLSGNETIAGTKTFSTTPVVGTVAESDNSTKAASTAYVTRAIATEDGKVVHLAGAETITGPKTFAAQMFIKGSDSNPLGFIYQGGDSGNLFLGLRDSNGDFSDNVITLFKDGNTNLEAALSITLQGTTPATTNVQPTDTNSTTSTQIATVGWVNDPVKSTNVVHRSGNETIAGTKTFSSNVVVPQTPTANTHATSKKYVDDGLSTKQPTITFTSSDAKKCYAVNQAGTALEWREVKDISTIDELEDTVINNKENDQSLVWDTSAASGAGAWVNKRPMIATISYW